MGRLTTEELVQMHELMLRATENNQLHHGLYVGGPTWAEESWKRMVPEYDLVLELENATDSVDVMFNSPTRADPL